MKTVFTEKHRLRDSRSELHGGRLVQSHERPSRAETVLARVRETGLGPVIQPEDFGMAPLLRVHDAGYVGFLQEAWSEWQKLGFDGEAMVTCWPARRMAQRVPRDIEGKLGYYALASETAICSGAWEAAYWSAQVALTGAKALLAGDRASFGLCRPPGHHAAIDMFGGYCFLNNAAIAAQHLLDSGMKRVAILDIDFHHGNGTQDIFYDRSDVFFASIHGEPEEAFPHFLGYADETGTGPGAGFTLNIPLPRETKFDRWRAAQAECLERIRAFDPQALVVSLGVDTFENDPISFFRLKSEDYKVIGADLAQAGLPTLFVMEGGYDVGEIGVNAVNVLQGFEA